MPEIKQEENKRLLLEERLSITKTEMSKQEKHFGGRPSQEKHAKDSGECHCYDEYVNPYDGKFPCFVITRRFIRLFAASKKDGYG